MLLQSLLKSILKGSDYPTTTSWSPSLRKGGIRADAMASQRSFRVSHTTTKEQKKKKYETSSFFGYGADYETRSARFCARRHAPDRRTVPRTVLCFATVFSSLLYHNRKTKKGSNECFLFVFGADYETRTRYLHLGKVTLYRMS